MSELEGARCVGKWWLFESTLLADHLEARELCDQCPVIAACRSVLQEEQAPGGTWAGELYGSKGKPIVRREHGTDRGYYQHRNRKEAPCQPCRDAIRFSMDARLKVAT